MERTRIIGDAMNRARSIEFERLPYRDKRSLFGFLKSYLDSAKIALRPEGYSGSDRLQDYRVLLGRLSKLSDKGRYMGLKSVDVKYVAATLFGDESGGFFGADFKGYSADDVMSYLEVCRRVFIAKYKPYIDVPASHAPSQKAASVSVAERNAYSEMTKFQLQIALLNNDVECAKYVLSRTELRELHENAAKLLH